LPAGSLRPFEGTIEWKGKSWENGFERIQFSIWSDVTQENAGPASVTIFFQDLEELVEEEKFIKSPCEKRISWGKEDGSDKQWTKQCTDFRTRRFPFVKGGEDVGRKGRKRKEVFKASDPLWAGYPEAVQIEKSSYDGGPRS